MQIKPSTVIWSIVITILIVFLYLVNSILMPFVFGAIVAYFLDPVVDKIEEYGPSRAISTIIVLVAFSSILGSVVFLVGPIFAEQFSKLANNLPEIVSQVEQNQGQKINSWLNSFAPDLQEKIKEFFYSFSAQIVAGTSTVVKNIITSGGAVINFLSLLIISPIIAFYLLRDYDVIVKKIDNLLPRSNLADIRGEFYKIDETVSAYIRGQVTVCIVMAVFYSASLSVIDLDYAVAIGIITGVLSFIPYAGMAIGMAIGLAVSYFQFGFEDGLLFTLVVFVVGNFLEGTFITPNLVGDKVRLHPAWIIFALLAGGAIMGFTGVLIAIPVAAILGVLIRSTLDRYKSSSLYLGYPIMRIEKHSDEDIAKTERKIKRGRGRPRKQDDEDKSPYNQTSAGNGSSNASPARRPIEDAPKKRGPGRPPKKTS